MDYREQYDRYVAMIEETIEKILPQTETDCPERPCRFPGICVRRCVTACWRAANVCARCCCWRHATCWAEISARRACLAAALEMIHTYSLIHDDLPGMDNDDYRRGRLTNHKVFGEGFAILAGDGLLNYAYECILKNALDYGANLEGHILAAREIAQRAGVGGMVAGQSIDLLSEHREPNEATLHYIHMHKTADLLTAPLLAAAYIAGADEKSIAALRTFGACVGLAFQIDDDLLDVMGDAKDLGKQTGMDEQRGQDDVAVAGRRGGGAEKVARAVDTGRRSACSLWRFGVVPARICRGAGKEKEVRNRGSKRGGYITGDHQQPHHSGGGAGVGHRTGDQGAFDAWPSAESLITRGCSVPAVCRLRIRRWRARC